MSIIVETFEGTNNYAMLPSGTKGNPFPVLMRQFIRRQSYAWGEPVAHGMEYVWMPATLPADATIEGVGP